MPRGISAVARPLGESTRENEEKPHPTVRLFVLQSQSLFHEGEHGSWVDFGLGEMFQSQNGLVDQQGQSVHRGVSLFFCFFQQ